MSLKENIQYVKTELTAQEQFIESFVKAEKFYKKNKNVIIAIVIATILAIIGTLVYDYSKGQNMVKANIALNEFLVDNNNQEALNRLQQTNKELYEIALHIKDSTHIPNVAIFKEIAQFQKALEENDSATINTLITNSNFLFKDYAVVTKALQEIKAGEFESAKNSINMLQDDSASTELANLIRHYISVKSN
ncbi:MAG: hypothetical protein GX118_06430 [Arcobacter butzleri]|jgi:hypothetical protein|nr:hypothetical protein [Arcobacteraceae bacterium]MDY0364231.1 hypothetical protein [Arcobacteraceae bacterium]NLO17811.1 hypothetical protein [Aliarcobacter butzleri]